MDQQLLRITDAAPVSGYILRLTFSNGEIRTFDFSSIFNTGILTRLKNPDYFLNYTLDGYTVDWNNEIGIAPEFLYENGSPAS